VTTALVVLAVIAAIYVAMLVLLWRHQERIVFQPPAEPDAPESSVRRLRYRSRDGVDLFALVVGPDRPAGPIVLAFHGNAMVARAFIPWAEEVARRFGATIVVPEYRGYDGLGGVPTYAGASLDAEAALAATCESLGVGPADVAYYGHSLGTAIACELAAAAPPRVLLLESPFTSARDMAARWPIVGLRLIWDRISRVHYDTVDRVAGVDSEVHVAHGERDIIIPARMGLSVHAAARRPGQLLLVPDAGHNDVAAAGADEYWRWFGEALSAPSQ
jgi:fermentation-respiration switch protein FrsA (DUF1100 family)